LFTRSFASGSTPFRPPEAIDHEERIGLLRQLVVAAQVLQGVLAERVVTDARHLEVHERKPTVPSG
jgi:hypothetical protein